MTDKQRLLLLQLPIVGVFTLALLVARSGNDGTLDSDFLRTSVYPVLRRMEGAYTDMKFRRRGPEPVRNKIVVVEIDDAAVEVLGRWPWHRDAPAVLVQSAIDAGAKAVGLDIVFAEEDTRVPPGVVELLQQHELGDQVAGFETDLLLKRIIDLNTDKLVLGWMSDSWCRPAYPDGAPCTPADPALLEQLPAKFEKFAYGAFEGPGARLFDPAATEIASAPDVLANLDIYNESAAHSGFLVSGVEDPDDVVRRAQMVLFVGGRPYPSLPLEMARIGLGEDLKIALDAEGLVDSIELARSKRRIPVSPTGALSINFRGPGYHFPFVGAIDLLGEEELIPVQHDGKVEKLSREEIFEDAYVLIGVTAIGARDLRHFPFGSNTPGTEGLATILDNVLSGDPIVRQNGVLGPTLVLLLMTLGALAFCFAMIKLDALPAMGVSLLTIGALALIDIYYVFGSRGVDLDAVFLLAELSTIFVVTVAAKYLLEERNKRFVRGTFATYLPPSVVDVMLGDPEQLKLGGDMRKLTIMMTDLRGFTATAQRLQPEQVLGMLNNYLGTMADIIWTQYQGTIDEFIGDAILVIFGAPLSRADDARRAVACAVAMQRAMKGVNEHNARLGLPLVEMGIGIHTGDVIVGNIGSEKRKKYGVVGSTVNLTARIESNTVGGQILISGDTLALAGDDIKIGDKQMIVAKGFPDPIPAYDIKGIGGEHNLYLDEVDLALVPLPSALDVKFRVMKSKNEEGEELVGRLTSISPLGAELESDSGLEALKNLKMQVLAPGGAGVDGDLYAKITEAGTSYKLRFTNVPPPVELFVKGLLEAQAPERSSGLAERG